MSNSKTKDSNKSQTKTSVRKGLAATRTATISSAPTPIVMRKSSLANHERHLKWEKVKQERAMNQVLLEHAVPLVETLVDIALRERNPNAINSLLDRAFGKARQNIGLDGGAEDKPIVFLPSTLMAKYAIKEGSYTELKNPGDDEPTGMLIEPLE